MSTIRCLDLRKQSLYQTAGERALQPLILLVSEKQLVWLAALENYLVCAQFIIPQICVAVLRDESNSCSGLLKKKYYP